MDFVLDRKDKRLTMKVYVLIGLYLILAGCASQQEVWNKVGLTQASLDLDYQACSNLAAAVPDIHNETNVYTSKVNHVGNQTYVTTGPDPYAQLGQTIRDGMDTDARRDAMRRYCMNTKGYTFVGMRDAPK